VFTVSVTLTVWFFSLFLSHQLFIGISVGDPGHFAADPDPTTLFIDFKDANYFFFPIFFLITCPQTHHLQTQKFYSC